MRTRVLPEVAHRWLGGGPCALSVECVTKRQSEDNTLNLEVDIIEPLNVET